MKITEKQLRSIIRESLEEISMKNIHDKIYNGRNIKWWKYASVLEGLLGSIDEDINYPENDYWDPKISPSFTTLIKIKNLVQQAYNIASRKDKQLDNMDDEYDVIYRTAGLDDDFRADENGIEYFDDDKFNDSQYGDLYKKYNQPK